MSRGKAIITMVVVLFTSQAPTFARDFTEEVFVARIETNDDRVIVTRSSGDTYVAEMGQGCHSLWRQEGGRVLIVSRGGFLGLGSTLLIPGAHQFCSIWPVARGKLWEDAAWLPPFLGRN